MAETSRCPSCGVELPSDAPKGFCPRCLYRLGFDETAPSRPPVQPGPSPLATSFGDYELLGEIGHGGMGVVYKARQKSLDRMVALKMLLFGPHASPESVKRFRAEAVATAALHHPNIVAIHEVGVCEGQHFIAMDYVEGQSLSALIRGNPLPARRAAGYVRTIAEAIHHAHQHGILHRDLKPANILIDRDDQPRVTDFGLAKRLEGDSELTVTGQVLGSPNYMPPEQAQGKRGTVSRRSDVYALGAILYHALSARPPFVGETMADTVQQVLNLEPMSPRALNPSVPADLETVCLKCLEKDPDRRYPTAQALAEELGRFLEGKPVLARPVGRLAKAWRWCRRNPRLAGALGAALFSLTIGLVGVSWQWRHAELQRQRAEAGELLARRNAYAADMKEVQRALDESDLGRARVLLNRHRPEGSQVSNLKSQIEGDLRSWEWRYLWARCQSEERFTLHQYSNEVTAAAFASDGKWLAVRQGRHAVALWDAVAQRPLADLPAYGQRWCTAVAFSPRGNLLAWGNKDTNGTAVVSLRDMSTQQDRAPLPHPHRVVSLAFSPDAKTMATLDYSGIVRVWDLERQQVAAQFATASVDTTPIRFAARPKATAPSVADATSGRPERESPPAPIYFTTSGVFADHYGCVLFSPDGRWLAVGEARPQIRLRDWATGHERIIPVPPPADGITALAFSPDSRRLAAGCGAATNDIHVWDLAAGTEGRLAGHNGWIAALAFSPDGQSLASASADQTVRLWDLARPAEPRRLQGNLDEVWALAWTPDGKALVTGARDGSVRYWDPVARPAPAYQVLPEAVHFWGPTFLPDSQTFLTTIRPEGAVVQWDTASLHVVERLSFLGTNHTSLDLSHDGRWLALGDTAGNVQVWDFPGRRLVTNLVFADANIFALWFSPRGNLLASGAIPASGHAGGKLYLGKLWTVGRWDEVSLPALTENNVFDGNFSPDERMLVLGYGNGTAAWWDLATGQRTAFFDRLSSTAVHAVFSPDGRHFATGGLDGLMTLRSVAARQAQPIGRGHRNALHDLLFSPDSRRLLASGTSPKAVIKFWDVETGRDLAALPGVPAWYVHIGFSPDTNTLFAGSFEGTALFWRAPSFAEIDAKEKAKSPLHP